MELIYSMRRKPLKCEPPHYESATDSDVVRPICTISSCNIIAFSSPTELSDSEGDTWGGHVYVCDLDTPWDSHKVTSTAYPVSALEWDGEGKQLLVASTVGDVSVYGQKDYLLNEWTCLYTANFPGEHIIKSAFFHNGRRIITLDKKPDAPITERIQMLRSTPTLKGFGGVACPGVCIITATGLIGVATPPPGPGAPDGARARLATEALRATRDHVTAAAIAHKNGNLLVACVCRAGGAGGAGGGAGGACVRVSVCSVAGPPPPRPRVAAHSITLQPLPAIYLPDTATDIPISITWCLREDTDSLLIAGEILTLWKCTESSHPVHKLLSKGPLQGNTTPGGGSKPSADCFNTVVWQRVGGWPAEGGAVGVASVAAAGGGAPLVVLATPHHLHLLARDTHHYICSKPVITSGGPGAAGGAAEVAPAGGTPPKKTKYGPGVLPGGAARAQAASVAASALGGALVCVDTHAQLHLYRLAADLPGAPAPALAVQHAAGLLEYSLVSGLDCLDVLLTLKHNIVDAVYDRFTENFQRQTASFQQYYYQSWLKLRIALCRLLSSPAGSASVSSLTCLQMCHAVWAACCAALRPDDKPDDKPLAALLDDHAHDHDKSLAALEAKAEAGETNGLPALRQCLQRALDIALTALLTLPSHHHHHHSHPYELWAEPGAVALLRKLVVLVRVCGRGSPGGGAAGAAGAGGAAAAGGVGGVGGAGGEALSRPLARLAAQGSPKPDLIEECAALSAGWAGARVWEALPRCSVSAPHHNAWPLYFEYGVEPEALRFTPEPPAYAQCETTPSLAMDSIRYMYLGGGWRPARWRQCGRCGARALPAAQPARHPLQKAYDSRFLSTCRCGGKWTLFSNI